MVRVTKDKKQNKTINKTIPDDEVLTTRRHTARVPINARWICGTDLHYLWQKFSSRWCPQLLSRYVATNTQGLILIPNSTWYHRASCSPHCPSQADGQLPQRAHRSCLLSCSRKYFSVTQRYTSLLSAHFVRWTGFHATISGDGLGNAPVNFLRHYSSPSSVGNGGPWLRLPHHY